MCRRTASSRYSMLWHLLMLVMVSWPGPIPVAHSHEDFSFLSENELDIRLHVSRFHGPERESDRLPLDRHVHWVFPALETTGVICRGTDASLQITARDLDHSPEWQELCSSYPVALTRLSLPSTTTDSRADRFELASFHAVGTLSSRRSLQTQFCTMQR